MKEAKAFTTNIPTDTIMLLRPLQKAAKECSHLIAASPWAYMAKTSKASTTGSSYTTQSPTSQVPLPMTPQSAALGPAVKATVPSTPQSASYDAMFSGNVFQRADAFLSMNGGSAVSSRAGTMTSVFNMGANDGIMAAATTLSPMNSMNLRFNGNGKPT